MTEFAAAPGRARQHDALELRRPGNPANRLANVGVPARRDRPRARTVRHEHERNAHLLRHDERAHERHHDNQRDAGEHEPRFIAFQQL
jgi:hypothetical protein